MKRTLLLALSMATSSSVFAVVYTNDFESDTTGVLPTGWTSAGWGDFAPGPISGTVETAPTGGQALKISWGTDWASYGASSGELDYTFNMTGIDPSKSIFHYEYDMYKSNWRVWQVSGDNTWFPPAGIHMNDEPTNSNKMVVGTDDYSKTGQMLTDVPENAWIHVVMDFNSETDAWQTAISYDSGSGGGLFSGTSTNDVLGQFCFGGWAFKSTMDNGGGVYDNAVYLDNIKLSVNPVPEPATLSILGIGALAMMLRKKRK
jgi:hypothetical protein